MTYSRALDPVSWEEAKYSETCRKRQIEKGTGHLWWLSATEERTNELHG